MKALAIVLGLAICAAVVLALYWCVWAAYQFALVPLGAPRLGYWQACAILFVVATVAGIIRGARGKAER